MRDHKSTVPPGLSVIGGADATWHPTPDQDPIIDQPHCHCDQIPVLVEALIAQQQEIVRLREVLTTKHHHP